MNDEDCKQVWRDVGNKFKDCGQYTHAERAWRLVLEMSPDDFGAMNEIGLLYERREMHDEALLWYAKAVRATGDRGAVELSNLGLQLWWKRDFETALLATERSVASDPNLSCAWSVYAMVLLDLQRADEALSATERAVRLDPKALNLLWNRSLQHLMLGHYAQGWKDFEYRYHPDNGCRNTFPPEISVPMWQGEDLAGKKLLVCKEQGFGDQMQCLRWLPHLRDTGADVTVWVAPALEGIVASVAPVRVVTTPDPPDEPFDYMVMLYSLPLRFGANEFTIPSGPYIHADTFKAGIARALVNDFARGRPKVGINYFGAPGPVNDLYRSAKIKDMLPLLDNLDVAWVSLHNSSPDSHPNMLYLGDTLKSFADTAGIVENLDLVITIDSGNAHLAAAMGKPVWMLLAFNNDYRWLLHRKDTPWYPTMSLFRQDELGYWPPVIDHVSQSLQEWISAA
jgi:Tfp pilus assembly protein PilF